MPAFRTSGSTGQAPTTSFFGPIPDRFNMLYAASANGGPIGDVQDGMVAANNINQWTIFNTNFYGGANAPSVTLGAMTTAPDGTNTAQKIVENSAANVFHVLTAGNRSQTENYTTRLAVFAKAAERTRIYLQISDSSGTSSSIGHNGTGTVFDLAGGQIGVANTAFGSSGWTAGPASITPFGNGWYLCQMDTFVGNYPFGIALYGAFFLDSGSGTGAISTTYTGDGSSGVYTWRCTCLPPAAWGMSGQRVFFDDFNDNTMSKFDLTNSRAPGFTWYLSNTWPNPSFNGIPATNPSTLSVSGSILKIATSPVALALMTAATDGASSYIGDPSHQFTPYPGVLFECRVAWDTNVSNWNSTSTFWSTSLQRLLNAADFGYLGVELDFYESKPGGASGDYPGTSFFPEPQPTAENGPYLMTSYRGMKIWQPLNFYNATNIIYYNGVVYQASNSGTGHQPDISPTFWSVHDPSTDGYPTTANTIGVDFFQQHTMSVLWLPWTKGSQGHVLLFYNGDPCSAADSGLAGAGNHFAYDPSVGGNAAIFYIGDGSTMPLMLASGSSFNSYFDWVAVTR